MGETQAAALLDTQTRVLAFSSETLGSNSKCFDELDRSRLQDFILDGSSRINIPYPCHEPGLRMRKAGNNPT